MANDVISRFNQAVKIFQVPIHFYTFLQVRRDWFAYTVLSALPWVGRELYEKKESELDRMLGSLEVYIKRRKKVHHNALRVFKSDHPHPQEEYLDCLWQQIKRLR